ncbi:hypothetical protein ABTF61_19530, partial [Acinetobacter baumannii]
PFILIALIEMIAFVRKLVGQAGCDIGDAPSLEWRLTAAETGLIAAATNGTYGNLRPRGHLVRRAIQLE